MKHKSKKEHENESSTSSGKNNDNTKSNNNPNGKSKTTSSTSPLRKTTAATIAAAATTTTTGQAQSRSTAATAVAAAASVGSPPNKNNNSNNKNNPSPTTARKRSNNTPTTTAAGTAAVGHNQQHCNGSSSNPLAQQHGKSKTNSSSTAATAAAHYFPSPLHSEPPQATENWKKQQQQQQTSNSNSSNTKNNNYNNRTTTTTRKYQEDIEFSMPPPTTTAATAAAATANNNNNNAKMHASSISGNSSSNLSWWTNPTATAAAATAKSKSTSPPLSPTKSKQQQQPKHQQQQQQQQQRVVVNNQQRAPPVTATTTTAPSTTIPTGKSDKSNKKNSINTASTLSSTSSPLSPVRIRRNNNNNNNNPQRVQPQQQPTTMTLPEAPLTPLVSSSPKKRLISHQRRRMSQSDMILARPDRIASLFHPTAATTATAMTRMSPSTMAAATHGAGGGASYRTDWHAEIRYAVSTGRWETVRASLAYHLQQQQQEAAAAAAAISGSGQHPHLHGDAQQQQQHGELTLRKFWRRLSTGRTHKEGRGLLTLDDEGKTPLHLVLSAGAAGSPTAAPADVVLSLIRLEPKAAAVSDDRWNRMPLHWVVVNQHHVELVAELVEAFPAALSAKDNRGWTALDYAVDIAKRGTDLREAPRTFWMLMGGSTASSSSTKQYAAANGARNGGGVDNSPHSGSSSRGGGGAGGSYSRIFAYYSGRGNAGGNESLSNVNGMMSEPSLNGSSSTFNSVDSVADEAAAAASWQEEQTTRWSVVHWLLLSSATHPQTSLSVGGKNPMLVEALLYAAPPAVISLLIGASAMLLSFENKANAFAGSTLYICIARHYPLPILQALALQCPPDVKKVRDETGMGLIAAQYISGCFEQLQVGAAQSSTEEWTIHAEFFHALQASIRCGKLTTAFLAASSSSATASSIVTTTKPTVTLPVSSWGYHAPKLQYSPRAAAEQRHYHHLLFGPFQEWWKKIEFLIAFCAPSNTNTNNSSSRTPPHKVSDSCLLHAALHNPDTPPVVIQLLLALYPDSVHVLDPLSQALPLHLAAMVQDYVPRHYETQISIMMQTTETNFGGIGSQSFAMLGASGTLLASNWAKSSAMEDKKRKQISASTVGGTTPFCASVVQMVLHSDTSAAVKHYKGRLALHYALAAGKTFRSIEPLVMFNPRMLLVPDPATGLYPFMLAAIYPNTSRDDAYRWSYVARNKYSHAVWQGLSEQKRNAAIRRVVEAEERDRVGTIFELLRRQPACIKGNSKKLHKYTGPLGMDGLAVNMYRDAQGIGMVAAHYIQWCYTYNENGAVISGAGGSSSSKLLQTAASDDRNGDPNSVRYSKWIPNIKNIEYLRQAIYLSSAGVALVALPDDFHKWLTKLFFWIRHCLPERILDKLPAVAVKNLQHNEDFLLHGALLNPDTPPPVVELFLAMYPQSAAIVLPGTWVLPLHIAVQTASYVPRPYEHKVSTLTLKLVLDAFPTAASRKSICYSFLNRWAHQSKGSLSSSNAVDSSRRSLASASAGSGTVLNMPLHIAIMAGKTWEDLEPLVALAPTALCVPETESGLYPFQLMASLLDRKNCKSTPDQRVQFQYVARNRFADDETWNRLTQQERYEEVRRVRDEYQLKILSTVFHLLRLSTSLVIASTAEDDSVSEVDCGSVTTHSTLKMAVKKYNNAVRLENACDTSHEDPSESSLDIFQITKQDQVVASESESTAPPPSPSSSSSSEPSSSASEPPDSPVHDQSNLSKLQRLLSSHKKSSTTDDVYECDAESLFSNFDVMSNLSSTLHAGESPANRASARRIPRDSFRYKSSHSASHSAQDTELCAEFAEDIQEDYTSEDDDDEFAEEDEEEEGASDSQDSDEESESDEEDDDYSDDSDESSSLVVFQLRRKPRLSNGRSDRDSIGPAVKLTKKPASAPLSALFSTELVPQKSSSQLQRQQSVPSRSTSMPLPLSPSTPPQKKQNSLRSHFTSSPSKRRVSLTSTASSKRSPTRVSLSSVLSPKGKTKPRRSSLKSTSTDTSASLSMGDVYKPKNADMMWVSNEIFGAKLLENLNESTKSRLLESLNNSLFFTDLKDLFPQRKDKVVNSLADDGGSDHPSLTGPDKGVSTKLPATIHEESRTLEDSFDSQASSAAASESTEESKASEKGAESARAAIDRSSQASAGDHDRDGKCAETAKVKVSDAVQASPPPPPPPPTTTMTPSPWDDTRKPFFFDQSTMSWKKNDKSSPADSVLVETATIVKAQPESTSMTEVKDQTTANSSASQLKSESKAGNPAGAEQRPKRRQMRWVSTRKIGSERDSSSIAEIERLHQSTTLSANEQLSMSFAELLEKEEKKHSKKQVFSKVLEASKTRNPDDVEAISSGDSPTFRRGIVTSSPVKAAAAIPWTPQNTGKTLSCILCKANSREVLMIPCRHLCICRHCSVAQREIPACPLCHRPVSDRMLIF